MNENTNQVSLSVLKLRVEANVIEAHQKFVENPTVDTLNALVLATNARQLYNQLVQQKVNDANDPAQTDNTDPQE